MPMVNLEGDLTGLPDPMEGAPPAIYWHVSGNSRSARPRGLLAGWSALGLLCRSTGSRKWIWDWRGTDGVKHRRQYEAPEKMSYAQAVAAVMRDRMILEAGVELDPPKIVAALGPTVGRLLDDYVAYIATSPRRKIGAQRRPAYVEKVRRQLEEVRRALGNRGVNEITSGDLERFLDRFLEWPAKLEHLEIHLSAMFAFGVRRDYCGRNPFDAVERRGHSGEREKFLDETELRLGLPKIAELGYPNGDVFMLALLTGRRLREVIKARWAEFELGRGTWELPEIRTKNRKDGHTLPLSPGVLDILHRAAEHKVGAGEFVFHRAERDRPIDNLKPYMKVLRGAMAEATAARETPAQREPFEFHDLRRTAATHLEGLECPLEVIKNILNHSDGRGVTGGYMRSDPMPRMRDWLTKLDRFYASLLPLALPAPPAPSANAAE